MQNPIGVAEYVTKSDVVFFLAAHSKCDKPLFGLFAEVCVRHWSLFLPARV